MTDKQKQIEAMVEFICENSPCPLCDEDDVKVLAGRMYNAGYRKQIESEWEAFDVPLMVRCSKCGVSILEIHRQHYSYCPYCGAKMKGGG